MRDCSRPSTSAKFIDLFFPMRSMGKVNGQNWVIEFPGGAQTVTAWQSLFRSIIIKYSSYIPVWPYRLCSVRLMAVWWDQTPGPLAALAFWLQLLSYTDTGTDIATDTYRHIGTDGHGSSPRHLQIKGLCNVDSVRHPGPTVSSRMAVWVSKPKYLKLSDNGFSFIFLTKLNYHWHIILLLY